MTAAIEQPGNDSSPANAATTQFPTLTPDELLAQGWAALPASYRIPDVPPPSPKPGLVPAPR